jgi:16S rRNA (guanine966-N2)-methyltransferase
MRIVSGSLKGRRLVAPEGTALRPTSDRAREALFNILAHAGLGPKIQGAHFIDGFCGTGAVGLEALSRGAASVTLIDKDTRAAAANLKVLGLAGGPLPTLPRKREREFAHKSPLPLAGEGWEGEKEVREGEKPRLGPITLLSTDMTKLAKAAQPAALAFLDPPYQSGLLIPALAALAEGGWLKPGALVAVEMEKSEAFEPPAGFEAVDDRRYGKARLVFLRWGA